MQPLGKDLRDLLSLLEKHEVRFLIVGGFAVANKRALGRSQDLTDAEDLER